MKEEKTPLEKALAKSAEYEKHPHRAIFEESFSNIFRAAEFWDAHGADAMMAVESKNEDFLLWAYNEFRFVTKSDVIRAEFAIFKKLVVPDFRRKLGVWLVKAKQLSTIYEPAEKAFLFGDDDFWMQLDWAQIWSGYFKKHNDPEAAKAAFKKDHGETIAENSNIVRPEKLADLKNLINLGYVAAKQKFQAPNVRGNFN